MKRLSQRSAQRGFALLEALVAVLLFSLGLLGLIGLQTRAISLSIDANDRNRAAMLANEIASTMWLQRSTTAIDTSASSAWQLRVADPTKDGLANGTLSITAFSANSADILIRWKAPARTAADATGNNAFSQLTTRVTLP